MSITSEISRISQNVSGAMTAIANKGVTVPAGSTSDDLADLISEIETGGGSTGESGVKFIDYDGTELYSYTTAQALALSALPANPTHTGLTAQGWNWTLAEIKSYLTNHSDGLAIVGQMYITDNGKTRIYIHFEDERHSPVIGLCVNGSVDIDWGDGTAHDTLTGTSASDAVFTQNHNYASGGDYVIELTVSGSIYLKKSQSTDVNCPLILRANNIDLSGDTDYLHEYYKNSIKKVELGNSVVLNNGAFISCYYLTTITIPNNTEIQGGDVFNGCYSLKSITIPKSITELKSSTFNANYSLKNVSIPNITSINDYCVFQNCYSLEYITLPDSITFIGQGAFRKCNSLKNIIIPGATLNGYICEECRSLKSVKILEGTTYLGTNAFSKCYSLENVSLPDSLTRINSYDFQLCGSLKSITIPSNVEYIDIQAFVECSSLEEIILPEGMTLIANYAFRRCYSLKNIDLPNGLLNINMGAFQDCTSLKSITIPNTVTSIGQSAFEQCESLENATIPQSVTSFGSRVFAYCYALKNLIFECKPTYLPERTFYDCHSLSNLILPSGFKSLAQYSIQCKGLYGLTIQNGLTYINDYAVWKAKSLKILELFEITTPPTLSSSYGLDIPNDCIIYVPYSADHSILTAYQSATNWSRFASQMQEEQI